MSDVIMVFNHDISGVLARTTSGTLKLSVDDTGLRFEFEAPETTLGNDMLELVGRRETSPSAPSSLWWRPMNGATLTIRTNSN
jgi:HK97 family phage prohead protease